MDFLPGFAWPVPRAFASAVAAGRFEQGDLLYDREVAYDAWDSARVPASWVQVLDPPRTARTAPADAEGNRFAANWASPVTLALGLPDRDSSKVVRCTQGRLFTCLWRGEREGLVDVEPGADEGPPLPTGSRELQKQLEASLPAVWAALSDEAVAEAAARLLFVTVVDEASEASLAKARGVEAALATRYPPCTLSLSPAEAGLPGGADFHPALRVRVCAVPETDPEVIRVLLKRVLYGPTRASGEDAADRFKLERHGLLVAREAG